jgi:protein phosphatase
MIEIGSALDPGRKRIEGENQDSLRVVQPEDPLSGRPALLVVADGMGGYEGGAIASSLVVQEMLAAFQNVALDGSPFPALKAGVEAAHLALQKRAQQSASLARMGSTVVAAVLAGRKIYLLNVGDSRAYLINPGGIRQISYDHSLVGEQLRLGLIDEDEVRSHPRRNVLSMAISVQREWLDPFTGEYEWQPGDVLVICSDGLWGPVPEPQIQSTVLELPPGQAAQKLVEMANANQGPDNIAVIVARFS